MMMTTLIMNNQNLRNREQIEKYTEEVIALFSKGNHFMAAIENSLNENDRVVRLRVHRHTSKSLQIDNLKQEGQMLYMVLDIFEHLELPIIIRWSSKHGIGDTDSDSLTDMMDNLGVLSQADFGQRTTSLQEEGTNIYEIIEQESRVVLAAGTSWSETKSAAWQFDIPTIAAAYTSTQEKLRLLKRKLDVVILSKDELLPTSRLMASELREAGFQVDIKQALAVNEASEHVRTLTNSEPRYFIMPGERHENIGESRVILRDQVEQTLVDVKMDHAIHLMTQILL